MSCKARHECIARAVRGPVEAPATSSSLERQLHPRGQLQAGGEAGHLLLDPGFDLVNRIVGGCGNQILQHLAILADHGRLDLHALDLMLAGRW